MGKIESSLRRMKWGDFALIGATLAVCLLLWGKLASGFSAAGLTVEIVAGSQEILCYDLDTGERTYASPDLSARLDSFSEEKQADGSKILHLSSAGIHFTIRIHGGAVQFAESDCPDQICVRTGALTKAGQTAACVPAGVLVRISGSAESDGVDVVLR